MKDRTALCPVNGEKSAQSKHVRFEKTGRCYDLDKAGKRKYSGIEAERIVQIRGKYASI